MLKFNITDKTRTLELLPRNTVEEPTKTIHWATPERPQKGTLEDNQECLNIVSRFVLKNGGPYGPRQYHSEGVGSVVKAWWMALNMTYGYPTIA